MTVKNVIFQIYKKKKAISHRNVENIKKKKIIVTMLHNMVYTRPYMGTKVHFP